MPNVAESDRNEFFAEVGKASATAVWCALATANKSGEPRVRMVHPTWEGDVLWIATGTETPKVRQMVANPVVDVQWQVAPPNFVHIMTRGRAEVVRDDAVRAHVWDVMDYDLETFFPGGPADPTYVAIRVVPTRVELSEMFGSVNQRVWRMPQA